MSTMEQLRQSIVNKQSELLNCSRELAELTKKRAIQQGQVKKKENLIIMLNDRSDLTETETKKLDNLKRDLPSAQKNWVDLEIDERICSQNTPA